tara:strand:+ start:232 stop:573 length:342 start_codon:yes stop_codon:yes gene_type:complete
MSSQNRLHAFTISPEASDIIHNIRNKKKSQFVTNAIIHFRKWQYTDHTQIKVDENHTVTDIKTINLQLEEKQKLLELWVSKFYDIQEQLFSLEAKSLALESKKANKKWYQFWK